MAAADPRDARASRRAADVLLSIVDQRLAAGALTVVDSTGSQADLLMLLRETAAKYDSAVTFVHVEATLEECLTRNASRHERVVPVEDVRLLMRGVEASLEQLSSEGVPVHSACGFLSRSGNGKKIFLAMPITENIGTDGFRTDKRRFYGDIHAALYFAGFQVASAAVSENYGEQTLTPAAFTRYDIDQIEAADCLVAATTTTPSSDIYFEIGLALGAGKPVGLLLPARGRTTAMMRGLSKLGVVKRGYFESDDAMGAAVLRMALSLVGSQRLESRRSHQ